MKIDQFLAQNPWNETFDLLCGEPPATEDLPLDVAAALIQRQRDSQIPSLIPLMLSPLVEGSISDVPQESVHGAPDSSRTRRLREPRRTARLFIDHAVRSGKDLRRFHSAQLSRLGADDAALGRLLRLLSIAGDSSLAKRASLAQEWRDVTRGDADFGPVLRPMVADADRSPEAEWIYELAAQLTERLAEESLKPSHGPADSQRLLPWVSTLAREGRERISELGADGH